MARTEWVKYRLDNWALWKDREKGGGLGFASQAAFLNEAATDRYREAVVPVDEVDASVTDQAVESLKVSRPVLYRMLQVYYIGGKGISGTMKEIGCPRSTVYACLEAADRAIARWFSDRDELMAQRKKSFTT